ncbi:alanyl-tRNA editing protein Aarsd1-like [Mizuhopecten yessoensis]|uniref:Alanyl-tRNA editing protein Aarsd1 n=1 Tax=Mizuhopecten yessoensis TaxID=6573 RepID=A0A210PH96_MIZYE|nr:alanyl-tRNA editing protein Aarsd1-like [Mizuhopecten yessoensis]OWF35864.1 Alanyl-tRNA editing protein Aarsd1 [Mizuhopecten yessoensis]
MALACQRNSYLRELKSKVKSCVPVETTLVTNGKKGKVKGYEVILEDTVLFPEGGGQPDDRGTINDIDVLRITRKGAEAVHFVSTEIPEATEVDMKVDWTRRFDHMQQHTGQHLITALAEQMFGCPTTSWCLGEKTSFIELDIPTLTEEDVAKLEESVNENILAGIPVTPHVFEDKNDPKLKEYRCRGLPEDHVGPVRVLDIEGIDGGTLCCGTHVSNLSHLQLIKFLFAEKGKKNKTNLHFVAGSRLRNYMTRSVKTERSLTGLLKGPLDQHFELADKAVKGFKTCQKNVSNLLKDLAVLEAQKYKSQTDPDPLFVLHRKEGDIDFMNIVVREINDKAVSCLLTVGDDMKGAGLFLLSGREEILKDVGPRIAEVMDGKGSTNRGNFQGKVNKLGQRHKAEKLFREFLQPTPQQTVNEN